jgi:tRNA G10  N-methylase Trm11
MRTAPRVYQSFEEFEREELRTLSSLHFSVDEMMDEAFIAELDFDPDDIARSRRKDEDDED